MSEQQPLPAIIVTGSSGLLGRPVCERLAELGHTVYGFDRVGLPEPPKEVGRVFDIECDLTDSTQVHHAVERVRHETGGRLASVVHLAAYYDFSGEDSPMYEDVTVNGTDRLLNALSTFELEQFIFTSTMLVHQACEIGERIQEDSPLEGKWAYPKSKVDTERLILEGHPNVRSVLLRIAGVYTDFGRQPTLVQQIKRIYHKDFQSHVFPGDTNSGQAVVHVDDCADAIVQTVVKRDSIASRTPILIGEPDLMSYEELQKEIGTLIHGEEWSTMQVPKPVAKIGAAVIGACNEDEFIKPFMIDMADDHYAVDTSRAQNLLNWHPKHCLRERLPKIIDFLKRNPEQFMKLNGLV